MTVIQKHGEKSRIHRKAGYFTATDGRKLYKLVWFPDHEPRAIIIIVHGFGEHTGRYEYEAEIFVLRGYGVVAYDQRGHGRSEGKRVYVRSFDHLVDDLDQLIARIRMARPDKDIFLFAHSIGGTVALRYAETRKHSLKGIVVNGPMIEPGSEIPRWVRPFSGIVSRLFPTLPTVRIKPSVTSHNDQAVREMVRDPLDYVGRIPARTGAEFMSAGRRALLDAHRLTVPLLIIHGTEDRVTNPACSPLLHERAGSKDCELIMLKDYFHETFREPTGHQVLERIVSWYDRHTAREIPDGRDRTDGSAQKPMA